MIIAVSLSHIFSCHEFHNRSGENWNKNMNKNMEEKEKPTNVARKKETMPAPIPPASCSTFGPMSHQLDSSLKSVDLRKKMLPIEKHRGKKLEIWK